MENKIRISDSVTSSDSTVAASSKAVKLAYDRVSSIMTGATASTSGKSGNVPIPAAGKQKKPLTGGGEYADSIDCDISGHASKDLSLDGGTISGTISFKDNSYDISLIPDISTFGSAIKSYDKNDKIIYQLQHIHYDNGQTGLRILIYDSDGNEYVPFTATYAPTLGISYIIGYTPPENDNSTKLSTTEWINEYFTKKPQTKAGIGQIVRLSSSGTNTCNIPSGGMWMYFIVYYPDIWNSNAGVVSGGTIVGSAGTGSNYHRRGFAWRIS